MPADASRAVRPVNVVSFECARDRAGYTPAHYGASPRTAHKEETPVKRYAIVLILLFGAAAYTQRGGAQAPPAGRAE